MAMEGACDLTHFQACLTQHQRRDNKETFIYDCHLCTIENLFKSESELWLHAEPKHYPPRDEAARKEFRRLLSQNSQKKINRAQLKSRPSNHIKRTLRSEKTRSLSGLGVADLNLGLNNPKISEDALVSDEGLKTEGPRKRAAIEDGRGAFPPPRPSKARQSLQPKPRTLPQTKTTTATDPSQALPAPSKDDTYDIILQPETRTISPEQLVVEVKGIYAGLVMVEAKCIEVDNKQATLAQADPSGQPKLNNEQWQALIALHRTLLHEHHDFFLASQHPSASLALRRLAPKYAMPARMWRHGIHSFLELLRHRLPASLNHMLAFIYLAYSMMALLYETVPAFQDTWIECLGDLGRYRMAIEDDDIRDREVWTDVSRHWYSKASDRAPTTGRLYHHLAILARPNALQQMFYYSKSLCVVVPFASARESILTLFNPMLNFENSRNQYRLPPLDTAFTKAHGLLFTNREIHKFNPTVDEFLGLLDNQISRVTLKFMEQGIHIAISNLVAMLGFGSKDNILMRAITSKEDVPVGVDAALDDAIVFFKHAQHLSNATLKIVLQRASDPNVLPFLHIILVFVYYMSYSSGAMGILEADFPWELLVVMLNTLLASIGTLSRIEVDSFPLPEKDNNRPFPEDFAMRGLLFADNYFPEAWFTNEKIDEEEKYHEFASMAAQRKERIVWLACRIAKQGPWISFDGKAFSARPKDSIARIFTSATTFGPPV